MKSKREDVIRNAINDAAFNIEWSDYRKSTLRKELHRVSLVTAQAAIDATVMKKRPYAGSIIYCDNPTEVTQEYIKAYETGYNDCRNSVIQAGKQFMGKKGA